MVYEETCPICGKDMYPTCLGCGGRFMCGECGGSNNMWLHRLHVGGVYVCYTPPSFVSFSHLVHRQNS